MESTEYERKARDWAEKKYNCKLRKKTWQLHEKKIFPDFNSNFHETVSQILNE